MPVIQVSIDGTQVAQATLSNADFLRVEVAYRQLPAFSQYTTRAPLWNAITKAWFRQVWDVTQAREQATQVQQIAITPIASTEV